ncbi:MAG: hypothetical protein ABIJ33_02005 [Patescibacteria group bacterium]
MLRKLLQNKFVRGSAIFTLASFGVSLLNYVFNLLVARFFPLDIYGEYMTAIVYMGFLTVPFGALNILLIRRIGMTQVAERQALLSLVEEWVIKYIKQHFFWCLLIVTTIAGILATQTNLKLESVIWILLMTAVSLATLLYSASLQAFKKFLASGLLGMITTLFKIVGGTLVLLTMPRLPLIYLSMILASALAFFVARSWVKEKSGLLQPLSYNLQHPLAYFKKKSVLIPTLATFGMIGILSLDVIMVKKFFGADEAGLYAGLSLLGKIVLYLTAPIASVAYAFFIGSDSKQNGFKILLTTSVLIIVAGLVIFAGYYFFPELVVKIIFGQKFLSIAPLAYLVAIFGIGYSLANLFIQYLISINHASSLFSVVVMIGQAVAIGIYHQTFFQIIIIGIVATSLLTCLCLSSIVKHHQQTLAKKLLSKLRLGWL